LNPDETIKKVTVDLGALIDGENTALKH